jgi:TolB-like protein
MALHVTSTTDHRTGALQVWLACALLLTLACGRADVRPEDSTKEGLRVSIVVHPFAAADSAPAPWHPSVLADSLAIRLNRMRGLQARTLTAGDRRHADFTLRGAVGRRDGRVVITTRLHRALAEPPVWTATFLRSHASVDSLATDIATAVVEALFADLGRRAMTTGNAR